MALIIIEDCLDNVENRFELVLLASKRARQLEAGAEAFFPNPKKEKSTIVALREISAGHVTKDNVDLLHQVAEPIIETPAITPFS
jgi:DNA-directed RNA polymerase subunit omega